MDPVIVGELSDRDPFIPVILSLIYEESKELFDFLVDVFGLPICLWVVGHLCCDFDPKELTESPYEVQDKLGSSITNDFLREAMEFPDIVSKQSGDPQGGDIGCGWNDVGPLGEAVHNNKEGIVAMCH